MKTKLLLGLVLLTLLSMASCKKDIDPPLDHKQVLIGDKLYRTAKIGNQLWITQNYSGLGGVYYIENNTPNEAYGKYYTLIEARNIPVPHGWRLPTKDDFKNLVAAQNAAWEQVDPNYGYSEDIDNLKKLLSKTGWPNNLGSDASGLNFYPAGKAEANDFTRQGYTAYFWTSSTTAGDNYPIFFHLVQADNAGYAEYTDLGSSLGGVKMSVRFVKDL